MIKRRLLLIFFCILCCSTMADGLQHFWEFKLPEGWTEINPGFEISGINGDKAETWVIFRYKKVDVSITICAIPRTAEDAARALYVNLKNLEKRYHLDAITEEPVERNGSWIVESVMGASKDIWYLTGNNSHYSIVNISTSRNGSFEHGKNLLKKLRPIDPTLFPKSYD